MQRMIRVSAVQLPAVIQGPSFAAKQRQNRRDILQMLRIAGERKSDLVLFGEYANLHHRTWSTDTSEYIPDPVPGALTRSIGAMAKKYKMNVAFPLLGTWQKQLSSHVVLLDRKGNLAGVYQKSHPTEPEQGLGLKPGQDIPVFELDCARVGFMTCMDIEYPEVAQVLMLRGAELILFPHVQASWGEVDWEIRYRARAIDTGLPVVSACHGYGNGEWIPGKMIGRTSVIGRDGLVVADIGRSIGVLTVDIDIGTGRRTHFFFNEVYERHLAVAASRRPELYGALVSTHIRDAALRKINAARKSTKG